MRFVCLAVAQRRLGGADAAGGLAGGGGQCRHGGDLPPQEDGLRVRLPQQGAQLGTDLL